MGKKKWGKITSLFFVLMLFVLMLMGCSSSSDNPNITSSAGVSNMAMPEISKTEYDYAGDGFIQSTDQKYTNTEEVKEEISEQIENTSDRKLIKTVNLSLESLEFEEALSTIQEKTRELGGYVENLETYNGSSYSNYRNNKSAYITLRIPKDKVEIFLNEIDGITSVISKNESVEDITLSYVDVESRKNALEIEYQRLIKLLENAESMEDIIAIEERLSSVRYQLESIESQLRTYDNKIDYSTVSISLEEVTVLTPIEKETVGERIITGFTKSVSNLIEDLQEICIWFIIKIPYFVVILIVIIIIVVLCKGLWKKSSKNKKPKDETIKKNTMENQEENKE